jgi:subtilase family serine protease
MALRRTIAAVVALSAAMAGVAATGVARAAAAPAPTPAGQHALAGSVPGFTRHAAVTGTVAGSRSLTVEAWLAPRTAAAAAYATAVSTPGSALHRHYLSPAQYTARFGATASEAASVRAWLRSAGFSGVAADAQRDYVRATAPVSVIDAAFGTRLRYYQPTAAATAGSSRLYANDSAVTIPASLAASVLGVTGLDNAAAVQPRITRTAKEATPGATGPKYACSAYWGQLTATVSYKQHGTGTYPTVPCGYSAAQLRSVYGMNSASTGKGQTVALIELGLTPGMFPALQKYAAGNALPAPSAARYKELSLGGTFAACGDDFYGEESLDVEAAYAMAPAASELVVGGDGCDTGYAGLQGLLDADLAVLNGNGRCPLATIASNSWESGTEGQAAVVTSIEHASLVKAAAEGVGMYFSSGDGSGVYAPSSDPYAIAAGGTTLGIGKTGNRLFETGWSKNLTGYYTFGTGTPTWQQLGFESGGGGTSLLWTQPSYQRGIVPKALATPPGNRSALARSVPDISADADPDTGMMMELQLMNNSGVITGYAPQEVGGTSLAAPLIAGMVAAAQQGQAKPFGFIDPAIYKISKTPAIHDALPMTAKTPVNDRQGLCDPYYCGILYVTDFDVQNYNIYGYNGQVTLPGYDNLTGVGTPAGQAFITGLRKLLK